MTSTSAITCPHLPPPPHPHPPAPCSPLPLSPPHPHSHPQIMDGDKYLWQALGSGLWPIMVLLSEVVQTFILADFCVIYVKAYTEGSGIIHLPAGIV